MSKLQLNKEEKVIHTKCSFRAYTLKYCIIRVINKIFTIAKRESNISTTRMITDRIGWQEVLLRINHNCYDFWTQQIHLGQISQLETIPKIKKSIFQKFPRFSTIRGYCYGYCANSVIGGFGLVDLVWLATPTVRLEVSDYNQLSDYSCTKWLLKNKAGNAPIKFEETIIAMINGFFIQLHKVEYK